MLPTTTANKHVTGPRRRFGFWLAAAAALAVMCALVAPSLVDHRTADAAPVAITDPAGPIQDARFGQDALFAGDQVVVSSSDHSQILTADVAPGGTLSPWQTTTLADPGDGWSFSNGPLLRVGAAAEGVFVTSSFECTTAPPVDGCLGRARIWQQDANGWAAVSVYPAVYEEGDGNASTYFAGFDAVPHRVMLRGDTAFDYEFGVILDEVSAGDWQVADQTPVGHIHESGLVAVIDCQKWEPANNERIGYSPVGSGNPVAWSWRVDGQDRCAVQRFPGDGYTVSGPRFGAASQYLAVEELVDGQPVEVARFDQEGSWNLAEADTTQFIVGVNVGGGIDLKRYELIEGTWSQTGLYQWRGGGRFGDYSDGRLLIRDPQATIGGVANAGRFLITDVVWDESFPPPSTGPVPSTSTSLPNSSTTTPASSSSTTSPGTGTTGVSSTTRPSTSSSTSASTVPPTTVPPTTTPPTTTPPSGAAACDGVQSIWAQGSFAPKAYWSVLPGYLEGSDGSARMVETQIDCSSGVVDPSTASVVFRFQDVRFTADSISGVSRSGNLTVVTGTGTLRGNSTPLTFELTLRDSSDTRAVTDYYKIKLFPPGQTAPAIVVKGPVKGHKIDVS